MLHFFRKGVLARSLTNFGKVRFNFCTSSEPNFEVLKEKFIKYKYMEVFNDLIKSSNNTVDNINYFKIYKFLEESNSEIKHYEEFFNSVDSTVQKKSDNIRMLLAKVKTYIAKKHQRLSNNYDALKNLEQAMQILQYSLIPPVLLYYQIYRYYGFIQHKLNNTKQALEALNESVRMIQKVIEHSEDQVNSNANSKNQAKAYQLLAQLDPANDQEWIDKCFESWKDFEGDKFELEEYAESIASKAHLQSKKNPEKAEEILTVHIYQFKDSHLKEYLKKKKEELMKQK